MKTGRIKKIFWRIGLIPKLGISNVIYVIYYRMLMKTGILAKKFPVTGYDTGGRLFLECPSRPDYPAEWKQNLIQQADNIVKGVIPYYSYHHIKQSVPPDWFINPFNGKRCSEKEKNWTKISDFGSECGDIKNVWEASRFSWAGILARAYAVSGDRIYLDTLNEWIADWLDNNPVNAGPNWKCGQEASVRVINLLNVAAVLNQADEPLELLKEVIGLHLKRISANTRYALAQRNNHASSEAAVLFIGGNWLAAVDAAHKKQYLSYAEKGRSILERSLRNLVYQDGSFAQHSVNYHRLFLDTLSFIIFWTRKLDLRPFSGEFYDIANKSADWLLSLTDISGRCPNLGPNDGTLLMSNHSCDYSDYRPSLQAASALVRKNIVFESGPWDEVLYWFEINRDDFLFSPLMKRSKLYSSGYVIMDGGYSWALLRFPFFRFRPSHNDVFHFDLWTGGNNILSDSGTFSYNPDNDIEVPDLKSVSSHNTLSFDKCEQMPRLGRFMLGKWLKPLEVGGIENPGEGSGEWEGAYRHYSGNKHVRRVVWNNNKWIIRDKFNGPAKYAELGFNFGNYDFTVENITNTLKLPWGEIKVSGNAEIQTVKHKVSSYYMQLSDVNRLVISVKNNSEISTTINIL